MAYTIYNKPEVNHFSNTMVPFRAFDSNWDLLDKFKYHLIIGENLISTTGALTVPFIFNNLYLTQFSVATPHQFKKGQSILIYNTTSNITGLYNIIEVPSTLSFVIDLRYVSEANVFQCYNATDFKFLPDIDSELKTQIQTVLDSKVHNEFPVNVNDLVFDSSFTHVKYSTIFGYESEYVFNFIDNLFVAGSFVGFYQVGTVANVEFNIGDTISILQDDYQWDYTSIADDAGNTQLIGPTITNHQVGQFIRVFNTQFQGTFEILAIDITLMQITIALPYQVSYTSGGQTFGQPNPEYDTVGTITDIVQVGPNVEIHTDIPFGVSTGPIGGTIKKYPTPVIGLDVNEINVHNVYHGNVNVNDYNPTFFNDNFYIDATTKGFASIIEPQVGINKYEFPKYGNIFLLTHHFEINDTTLKVEFLDASGTSLVQGIVFLSTISTLTKDYHIQLSPSKMLGHPDYNDLVGTLTQATIDNFKTMRFYFGDDIGGQLSKIYEVDFSDKCTRYEDKWNLIFEDKYGSFLNVPFHYGKKEEIFKKENSIYKSVGKFDITNNTFGHSRQDGGVENYITEHFVEYTLNSGYVTKLTSDLIKDMVISNNVFLEKDPNDINEIYRVSIVGSNFKITDTRDDLVNYQIKVRYAIKENRI